MRCPVCEGAELAEFFEARGVPVFCNVLHATRDEALAAPRGDIVLGSCAACGMLYNVAFDAARVAYVPGYENSLHGSPRFHAWAEQLADGLVQRHRLAGARLLEIGGGRGEFLALLCRGGRNRGELYDPSAPEGAAASPHVRIHRRALGEAPPDGGFALVCARHVLEHVPDPLAFVRTVVAARGADPAAVYLEVPNALWTLRDLGVWDVLYEHCSYFAPCSLAALLERAGLGGAAIRETFGGQFLAAETGAGVPGPGDAPDPAAMQGLVAAFAARHAELVRRWTDELAAATRAGRRVALWGAGTKGVTLLNTLPDPAAVDAIADVNPLKHGRFVPGSAHRVLAPGELARRAPDRVVVMNPLYLAEVTEELRRMGFQGRVVAA